MGRLSVSSEVQKKYEKKNKSSENQVGSKDGGG